MDARNCLTLPRCLCVLAGAALAATALARPAVYGGGVIADRDPQNDTIANGLVFAVTNTSIARAGVCTLGPSDFLDRHPLTVPAGAVLTAMTVPLTGTLGVDAVSDTELSIYGDSSGVTYADNDDAGTDQTGTTENSVGSVARAVAPSAGTYEIVVSNVLTAYPTNSYGVLVSVYTGDGLSFEEQEPNNGPAFPLVLGLGLGGPMVGTGTLTSGDVDYYAVDMRRGDTLAAMTTPVQGIPGALNSPDTVLEVIGSNGATVLCANDDAGADSTAGSTRGSAVRFRAPSDGRYFLRVKGFNASATGKYALTAGLFAPPAGSECPADLNGDGFVNTNDLTLFLSKFGTACP